MYTTLRQSEGSKSNVHEKKNPEIIHNRKQIIRLRLNNSA